MTSEQFLSQYISEFKNPKYEHSPGQEGFFSRAIVRVLYKPEITPEQQRYITRTHLDEITTVATHEICDDFVIDGKYAFPANELRIIFVDESKENEIVLYFKHKETKQ